MSTFFIITVVAVLVILATILIAGQKKRSKGGIILVWGIILAAVLGVIWAYKALITPSCVCVNMTFRTLEIIFAITILWGLLKLVGPYIIGIAAVVGAIFLMRWLFINGIMDGSFLGTAIAVGVAGFCGFTLLAIVLAIKRALK